MTKTETLRFANNLINWGIPVIVCKPRPGSDDVVPIVSWKNITEASQCQSMLSRFEFGVDALALIGGHGIDLIDVDTKANGSIEPFGDLEHYGITKTPSGGQHYVIHSTGLKRVQGLTVEGTFVGDYIGGTEEYESRMLGFLPGSARPKYGDVLYGTDAPWDIEGAVLGAVDERVKEILVAAGASADEAEDVYVDDSPERDEGLGVHPYAAGAIRGELERLKSLPHPWAPGSYWDDTTFEVACTLLRLANSHWTGYSRDDALADLLAWAPSDERWGEREHKVKWHSALVAVGDGGRSNPDDPSQDFDAVAPPLVSRPVVDVSNTADALDWIFRMVGREGTPLAGLFQRDQDLIFTPRVGETGYVPPPGKNHDGPAQVRRMTSVTLCAYIDARYRVVKQRKNGVFQPTLFSREVALRGSAAPDHMIGLRPLYAVSHTPLVRRDGTVMRTPGYDDVSHLLFLPDRGLTVPNGDGGGVATLDEMLEGFPFVTQHDYANYLAALLTPLLRSMVPPPYPLIAIGAPQPGSGKSLLARVLRIVHGGVFRSEMVRDSAEFRKQITSILDSTSAPVVTFDNVNGTLRSPIFDGLITSAEWTDRILGGSLDRTLLNDRLWTITGNNLQLGGDLKRRTIWVTIDPKMEHPETRVGFAHLDLPGWVETNRGRVLAALLGMVSQWVEAGRPIGPRERTDSFGEWHQIVGAILRHAGVEGTIGHEDSVRQAGLEDEDEWGKFLAAVEQRFGREKWQVRDVMGAVDKAEFSDDEGALTADHLPVEIVEKMRFDSRAASKSLGRWLQNRADRWFDGLAVHDAGMDRNKTRYWRIISPDHLWSDLM